MITKLPLHRYRKSPALKGDENSGFDCPQLLPAANILPYDILFDKGSFLISPSMLWAMNLPKVLQHALGKTNRSAVDGTTKL